ncbi:MAG: carboxypeptidase-like regulatory domain-containing protein [Candidatus Anstonellales archaeon]
MNIAIRLTNTSRVMAKLLVLSLLFFSIVNIQYSVKLFGSVYDAEKSKLANVKLTVQVGETSLYEYNVVLGNYDFNVPKGAFFLIAEKQGYPKWIGKLSIERDMNFDIYMIKRSGYYLYGRFYGENNPLTIELYQNNKRVARDTTTSNGLFLFTGLPKGVYELRISSSKYNISQNIVVDNDVYIDLYPIISSSSLFPISEQISINNSFTKNDEFELVVPNEVNVNEYFNVYVIPLAKNIFNNLTLRILELNRDESIEQSPFSYKFEKPGTYTIAVGDKIKKIRVLSNSGNTSKNPVIETNATNVWTYLDYSLIAFLLLIMLFNFFYVLYKLFLSKTSVTKVNERMEHISSNLKNKNLVKNVKKEDSVQKSKKDNKEKAKG